MIRGDNDVFSIMDEMCGGGALAEDKQKTSNDNIGKKDNSPDGIRMVPELDGYGEAGKHFPEIGDRDSSNIWNPYVSVNISSANLGSIFFPTSPYVEVARRRAYEKFKKNFYKTFSWVATKKQLHQSNHKSSEKETFDFNSIWGKSSHSILERYFFASKVEETFHIMANRTNNIASAVAVPKNADVTQIANVVSAAKGRLIDPILVAPFQRIRNGNNLLKNEVCFQLKREYKKATKAKNTKEVEEFFQSKMFQRNFSATARGINDVAIEAEGDFLGDLQKKAKEISSSHQSRRGKKKGIPRLSFEMKREKFSDDIAESFCLTFSGLSFRISKSHFEKLQILFDRHNQASTSLQEHRDSFYCALFTLLTRYDLLEGAGLQSSLNGNVFDVLLKEFTCNTECFASPFNCRYERFFSAFEDTDEAFGSLGSFFNFDFERLKNGGCFQANPPFASDFILQMCKRIENLLSDNSLPPFMFIVFVPSWQESEGWQALSKASSLIHHLCLSQKDDIHYYCEGTQHRRLKGRYRVASFDTSVFFMQNYAGKKKWSITEDTLRSLKDAFGSNPENVTTERNPTTLPVSSQKKSLRQNYKNAETLCDTEKSCTHPDKSQRKRKSNERKSSSRKNAVKKAKIKKKLVSDDGQSQMAILSSLGIVKACSDSNQTTGFTKSKKRKNQKN